MSFKSCFVRCLRWQTLKQLETRALPGRRLKERRRKESPAGHHSARYRAAAPAPARERRQSCGIETCSARGGTVSLKSMASSSPAPATPTRPTSAAEATPSGLRSPAMSLSLALCAACSSNLCVRQLMRARVVCGKDETAERGGFEATIGLLFHPRLPIWGELAAEREVRGVQEQARH